MEILVPLSEVVRSCDLGGVYSASGHKSGRINLYVYACSVGIREHFPIRSLCTASGSGVSYTVNFTLSLSNELNYLVVYVSAQGLLGLRASLQS